MTNTKPAAGEFRGRLAGRAYTDRAEFEKAARGYVNGHNPAPLKVGADITFEYDGKLITGQVWARGPKRGTWWVQADGQTYHLGIRSYRGRREADPVDAFGKPVRRSA